MTAEGTGTETSARAPAEGPAAVPADPSLPNTGAALAPSAWPSTGARLCLAAVTPPPSAPADPALPAPPAHPAAAPASPESTTVAATATVARRIPVIAHPFAVDASSDGENVTVVPHRPESPPVHLANGQRRARPPVRTGKHRELGPRPRPAQADPRGHHRRRPHQPGCVRLVPLPRRPERAVGASVDVRRGDRVPRPRRHRVPLVHPLAEPVRRRQGAAAGGRDRPPPGLVLALLVPAGGVDRGPRRHRLRRLPDQPV